MNDTTSLARFSIVVSRDVSFGHPNGETRQDGVDRARPEVECRAADARFALVEEVEDPVTWRILRPGRERW